MRDETSALKLALLGAVRDGVVPDSALVGGVAYTLVYGRKLVH